MSAVEKYRKRVIEVAEKDFLCLDDGYWALWIDTKGAWKAEDLRVIADELDRRNAPWDAQIQDYSAQEEVGDDR